MLCSYFAAEGTLQNRLYLYVDMFEEHQPMFIIHVSKALMCCSNGQLPQAYVWIRFWGWP